MLIKSFIPALIAAVLLSAPVYATDRPADTPVQDAPVISVIDITPQEDAPGAVLSEHLPMDIQSKTEDGVKLLVKTYEVSADITPQELVEQGLTRNGVEYILRDVLRETLPGSSEQQTASQTVTVSSESDKQVEILPLLPEYLDYSENGFTGRLTLDAASINTEVESTSGYTYTVRDTRDFPGLPRNDPYLIPKTSAKNGVSLALTDVKWSPSPGENEQHPTYTATAYYTGKASGSKANGYLVTAQYSGAVEKIIPGNVRYSLVYEAVPVPIIPESFDWTPVLTVTGIVILAGGMAVLGIYVIRRLTKRKRVVFGESVDCVAELEARPERRKPHALGYMRRDVSEDE